MDEVRVFFTSSPSSSSLFGLHPLSRPWFLSLQPLSPSLLRCYCTAKIYTHESTCQSTETISMVVPDELHDTHTSTHKLKTISVADFGDNKGYLPWSPQASSIQLRNNEFLFPKSWVSVPLITASQPAVCLKEKSVCDIVSFDPDLFFRHCVFPVSKGNIDLQSTGILLKIATRFDD